MHGGGRQSLAVNGEQIHVPAVPHLKCPKCGEVVYRLDDLKRLHQGGLAIYREKHALLSPDELQAIRERLGLS